MRRIFALILLTAWSSAHADWKEVVWEGDRAIYGYDRVFIDYSSIQRTGDTVRLSWLGDFRGGKNIKIVISDRRRLLSYYSVAVSSEFNCRQSESRDLAHTYYTGPMGTGTSYEEPKEKKDWSDLKRYGPTFRAIAAVACAR